MSEQARSYTGTAFRTLLDDAIEGSSDSARVAAANSILDRGYGTAKADLWEVVHLPDSPVSKADITGISAFLGRLPDVVLACQQESPGVAPTSDFMFPLRGHFGGRIY